MTVWIVDSLGVVTIAPTITLTYEELSRIVRAAYRRGVAEGRLGY